MNNADMPVTPLVNKNGHPYHESSIAFDNTPLVMGLTKREHFCLHLGIPETGDKELDALIIKGERNKLVAMSMQGLLASDGNCGASYQSMGDVFEPAIEAADAILKELDKQQQGKDNVRRL